MKKIWNLIVIGFSVFNMLFSLGANIITYEAYYYSSLYTQDETKREYMYNFFLHHLLPISIGTIVLYAILTRVKYIIEKESEKTKKDILENTTALFNSLNNEQIERIDKIDNKVSAIDYYNKGMGADINTNLAMMLREVVIPKLFDKNELIASVASYPHFSKSGLFCLGFGEDIVKAASASRLLNEVNIEEYNTFLKKQEAFKLLSELGLIDNTDENTQKYTKSN